MTDKPLTASEIAELKAHGVEYPWSGRAALEAIRNLYRFSASIDLMRCWGIKVDSKVVGRAVELEYVCGFCGEKSPPTYDGALQHAEACPKHPAVIRCAELEASNKRLLEQNAGYIDNYYGSEAGSLETTKLRVRVAELEASEVGALAKECERLERDLLDVKTDRERDGRAVQKLLRALRLGWKVASYETLPGTARPPCGGSEAFLRPFKVGQGAWEMVGCVCHTEVPENEPSFRIVPDQHGPRIQRPDDMTKCRKGGCGALVEQWYRFCPFCGTQVER